MNATHVVSIPLRAVVVEVTLALSVDEWQEVVDALSGTALRTEVREKIAVAVGSGEVIVRETYE